MTQRTLAFAAVAAAAISLAATARAALLVDDTWQDGERATPASPTYSEFGVNADPGQDSDLESAWFNGGASVMTSSAGHLNMDLNGTSANWTTYFTPEGSEVNLAANGNKLRVTWQFSVTGLGGANTSQNFRFGLVDSIPANRIAVDGNPPAGAAGNPYTGYAIFANMGQGTLGNSNPYRVMERIANGGSNAILGTSGDWGAASLTGTTNGATTGNSGWQENITYTMVWELTRNGAGIDINSTLTGGTFNTSGVATITANDANGNGFTFDTFNVRPSSEAGTTSVLDTTLFRVETFVPEPGSAGLMCVAALAALFARRRV